MLDTKSKKGLSFKKIIWREFKKDKLAVIALWFIFLLFIIVIFSPLLANNKPIMIKYNGRYYFPIIKNYPIFIKLDSEFRTKFNSDFKEFVKSFSNDDFAIFPPVPYSPTEISLPEMLKNPSEKHLLGTDNKGRDVLSRLIHGSRISLSVGFVAVGIYVLIGIIIGSLAGFYGGWVDNIISRFIEIVICFPSLILILAIIAIIPRPNIYDIMFVIGITGWPSVARFVRGEFLKLRNQDFVMASKALGSSNIRQMFRHILPNALAPVLVSATFGIAAAIVMESTLSFLGLGVPPPTPSWGEVLHEGRDVEAIAWWLVIFPGLAIFITVTAYNLVGESFRDAIDPRLRER